jgi:hypothetical protein
MNFNLKFYSSIAKISVILYIICSLSEFIGFPQIFSRICGVVFIIFGFLGYQEMKKEENSTDI